MGKRLAPYGNQNYAGSFAAVGDIKGPARLGERLASREATAKVGVTKTPAERARRVVRLKAKAR